MTYFILCIYTYIYYIRILCFIILAPFPRQIFEDVYGDNFKFKKLASTIRVRKHSNKTDL